MDRPFVGTEKTRRYAMYDIIDLKSKRASQSSLKVPEHSTKPDDKMPSNRGPSNGGALNELSSLEDITADRQM